MTRLGGLLLAMVAACAPSPLLRPDDAVHARALARYQHLASATCVDAAPVGPDGALFLQALALDEYRFDERPRSGRSYAAQALAAASDLAPLAALAAQNGLGDLRLLASSGAAQLYEHLLARHPQSPLAPLALFRLGFARWNDVVGGFPRESPEVFAALGRLREPQPARALAADASALQPLSPDAALAWSILPGAGQIYVGETGSGVLRLGVAAGFAAMTVLPVVLMARHDELDWRGVTLALVGLVGLQVTYTVSYQDAQRSAVERNERAEETFFAAHAPAIDGLVRDARKRCHPEAPPSAP